MKLHSDKKEFPIKVEYLGCLLFVIKAGSEGFKRCSRCSEAKLTFSLNQQKGQKKSKKEAPPFLCNSMSPNVRL